MINKLLAAVGGLTLLSNFAVAADYKAGETAAAACVGCHGAKGVSASPAFPNLAGQYPDYIVHALKQYKSGERSNPMMAPMVTNLSEDDMKNLALFYSKQEGGVSVAPRKE